MAKQFGLGRGLDDLLASTTGKRGVVDVLQNLSVEAMQTGKYQPRTHMDPESLQQLADSIRQQGIVQPIVVRPVGDHRFEILAGERRWRAAKMAGLTEVPVLVKDVADEMALTISLIENIQRENLNPLEEAQGIQRLIDEFHMTHQQAAETVGRSRSTVTNLLRLLQLTPPVQDLLMQERIDMGHARALLALPAARQAELAHEIDRAGWSVRETEMRVQRMQKPAIRVARKPDADVIRLQEDLADRLGADVEIRAGRNGAGQLVIRYASLEQLENILSRL